MAPGSLSYCSGKRRYLENSGSDLGGREAFWARWMTGDVQVISGDLWIPDRFSFSVPESALRLSAEIRAAVWPGAEDESGEVPGSGRVLVALKFSEADLSWGVGGNQQQLRVIWTQGAPSWLSDRSFAAFSVYPFGFLLPSAPELREHQLGIRTGPCFPSARQLAFGCRRACCAFALVFGGSEPVKSSWELTWNILSYYRICLS